MTQDIKTERRWLRSVIVASAEPLPNFPWMRGERRKPQALRGPDEAPADAPAHPAVSLFGRRASMAAR
jgi:hypothetical protein